MVEDPTREQMAERGHSAACMRIRVAGHG
jgi:hypothetical protein